ncbi:MAG: hypothetical protein KF901_28385 [Myxococcales bacterium]|nr:hypothetical protein [Myxococcales bacterium]
MEEDTPKPGIFPFVREKFGFDFEGGKPQVEYLWAYLEEMGAQCFVREVNYVDRHYLDDFTHYYARAFRPPEAHCICCVSSPMTVLVAASLTATA